MATGNNKKYTLSEALDYLDNLEVYSSNTTRLKHTESWNQHKFLFSLL